MLRSKKGLTLIELLITTSTLGIIALAIFSSFSSGLNIYKRIQNFGKGSIDVLLTLERMEQDFRNMFNFSGIDFIGDSKKIGFPSLVTSLDAKGNKDLSVGRIYYYLDIRTHALSRIEQDYPNAKANAETAAHSKELALIKDINFSYYLFDPALKQYNWKTSVSDVGAIPRAIKIEIIFEDNHQDVKLSRTIVIPAAS